MAHFVRNIAGRKAGGEQFTVKLDIKEYNLILHKKGDVETFSFCSNKKKYINLYVDNFETTFTIPSSGFWQIAIKSNISFSYLKFAEECCESQL